MNAYQFIIKAQKKILIAILFLSSFLMFSQCPQNIVFPTDQTDAVTHINNSDYRIGSSRMTISNTRVGSAGTFTTAINSSHQSARAILIDPGDNTNTSNNRLDTQISFSQPVFNLTFNLNDIDDGDRVRVEAFDQNNLPINFGTSNYTLFGATQVSYSASTKEFSSSSSNVGSSDTNLTARIAINFNGLSVSRFVVQYYDVDGSSSGSYTIHNLSGAVTCANPDFFNATKNVSSTTTVSVVDNDIFNSSQATTTNVTLSAIGPLPAGFTFNANGTVSVANNVPVGVYRINYQICGTTVSGNCATSYAVISVNEDSDADTVPDYLDLDDDNDGILDTAECPPTSVVTNGTFTGSLTGWTAGSGWLHSSAGTQTAINEGDAVVNSVLSQSVTNLSNVENGIVRLNLRVGAQDNANSASTTSALEILLNGTVYATLRNGVLRNTTNITLDVAAGVSSTFTTFGTGPTTGFNYSAPFTINIPYSGPNAAVLAFRMVNGPDDWSLDDISINASFCDTDGDGIRNSLDLDSDNDGCSDAVEGASTTIGVGNLVNSAMPGGNSGATSGTYNQPVIQNFGNTVNLTAGSANYGVPTVAGSGQAIGQSQNAGINDCIDSDGDNIPDYADQDDDNDGILDINECTSPTVQMMAWTNNNDTYPASASSVVATGNLLTGNNSTAGAGLTRTRDATQNYQVISQVAATTEAQAIQDNEFVQYVVNVGSKPIIIKQIGYYRISSTVDNTPYSYTLRVSNNGFLTNNLVHGQKVYTPVTAGSDLIFDADQQVFLSPNTTYTFRVYFYNVTGGTAANFGHDDFKLFGIIECDTDGDGIPNRLDLDSDGDGCPDAREGAGDFNPTTTASGTIAAQTPNTNFGTAVDSTTGIPTAVATGQAIGQSQDASRNDCLDSDGDTIPDWQDLDDDNDGILDTAECSPILASYSSSTISGGATASATISGISFGHVMGTLTRVNNGTTVIAGLAVGNSDMSNASIFTPAGSSTQAVLTETLGGTKGSTFYSRYTLTLNSPVESIILHAINFDYMKTRFIGARAEQLVSGGSEFVYNPAIRELYDANPNTHSTIVRDGYGSIRITNTDGSPITQIIFDRLDDPLSSFANDGFSYTFSIEPICDTDGDGIPNRLDLDSDGDGCTDAIEGGNTIAASSLVTVTVGPLATQTPNQNLGNTVGNTATTLGVPTIVATGQTIGNSQDVSKNDCLDSDGDGIPDWQDVDDDNDGILDTEECSNAVSIMYTKLQSYYSDGTGGAKGIVPSDFGLVLGVKNQTVTRDLSAKFGYPANSGALVITLQNASVHPLTNSFWTKDGEAPTIWTVSGKLSSFVLMAQNPQFYGQDTKTIHIYDGSTVIPFALPSLENEVNSAEWSVSETATVKTLRSLRAEQSNSTVQGDWRFVNMNFGDKRFGFSTTTRFADPTYEVVLYLECDSDMDGIPNRLDLDSDADGCSDALEGGANILANQLLTAGGTVNGGSTSVNQNICTTCVSTSGANIGLPQFATLPTGYSNTTGQTVGDSQNGAITACYCTQPPAAGTGEITRVGISVQQKQANWPENIPNGHIVLESKEKGLVITRVAHVSFVPQATDSIASPFAGMLVYDIQDACVKLFNGINWKCLERSCNTASN